MFVRADLARSPKHGTLAIGREAEPAANFVVVFIFYKGKCGGI